MTIVSVIIPTYNRAGIIEKTLFSVIKQTLSDIEIIVVDDGSTDNTRQVVEEIRDSRIRYFYKENGGASSARNLGLTKAGGEYIAFLDSDDLWPENYLECMISALENHKDCGAAYSLFRDKLLNGTERDGFGPDRHISGRLTAYYFGKTPSVSPSASIFRRKLWDNFWWDESLGTFNDVDTFLRLSTKTQFLFVEGIATFRNHTPDSLIYVHNRNFSMNPVFVLERFYYQLGGKQFVPEITARKKISREYRGLARQHYKAGNRKAAVDLLKKAIAYFPYDYHYYKELLKALCMSRKKDKIPGWQMPKSLPPYITVNNKVFKRGDKDDYKTDSNRKVRNIEQAVKDFCG